MSDSTNLWIDLIESLSKSRISILRWLYTPSRWPCDLTSSLIVCARNLLVVWMSYANESKGIFKWKKCRGSKMKFDRMDRRERKVKVVQGLTHKNQTISTNQTNISLFQRDQSMSVTDP